MFVTAVDGGAARRLTWWGDPTTKLIGWTPDGEVLAVSATGQPSRRHPWAYAIPPDGGTPGGSRWVRSPISPSATRAPTVLLSATMTREMAWQKRYRGGTAGKLWWNPEGAFVRLAAGSRRQPRLPRCWSATASRSSPTTRAGATSTRSAATADDSGGLRRHTDHGADGAPAFYARHAATDGTRVVYESAGQLWLLDDLDAEPRPLDVRLGGPRTAREPYRITTGDWLGRVIPDTTGRSSIVTVRGTVHRLTHRDGPARTLHARPGVRARLAAPLGADRAVWVDDALGEDAVCIAPLRPARPRRARRAALRRR